VAAQEVAKDNNTNVPPSQKLESNIEETKPTYLLPKNSFALFKTIMEESYDDEMASVECLVHDHFNGKAYLTGGRWHFAIPHISQNNSAVFGSTFDPNEMQEKEDDETPSGPIEKEENEKAINSKTTVHDPHKSRSNKSHPSKRLRPYHVRALKEMFERGGYTLETVMEDVN